MLVVENLSLNNLIVVFSSESATGQVLEIVVEALAHDVDVGVFTEGT